MTGLGVKRFLTKAFGLKPADPKPLFDGPPAKPEYYLLGSKPGARYADKGPSVYQLVDEAEAQRQRKQRFERYLEQFPEKRGQITDKAEVLRSHDAVVDPDHVPTFGVFRKKVSFASNTFTDLSVAYGVSCWFVLPAFNEAVEAVAPGLFQFFPYECRLKTGEVFAQLHLMHWSKVAPNPIDLARSGLGVHGNGLRRQERERNGQIVIQRSRIDGTPMQIFGLPVDTIYSRPMAERLQGALGRNQQFYPVHVCDDV